MSDIGLNASIYEQLRIYADRFDVALVNLRSSNKSTVSKAREELADLLREIGSEDSPKPGTRLVAMVLKQDLSGSLGETGNLFRSLAEVLEKRVPAKEEVAKLEQIALAIDKECSSAGARMRGRG